MLFAAVYAADRRDLRVIAKIHPDCGIVFFYGAKTLFSVYVSLRLTTAAFVRNKQSVIKLQ